jgi:hypothetical protein
MLNSEILGDTIVSQNGAWLLLGPFSTRYTSDHFSCPFLQRQLDPTYQLAAGSSCSRFERWVNRKLLNEERAEDEAELEEAHPVPSNRLFIPTLGR